MGGPEGELTCWRSVGEVRLRLPRVLCALKTTRHIVKPQPSHQGRRGYHTAFTAVEGKRAPASARAARGLVTRQRGRGTVCPTRAGSFDPEPRH